MDIISWLLGCRNVHKFGFVYHDTNGLNHGPLWKRNLNGHPLAGLLWDRQFEKILLQYGWEKVSNCECLFVHRQSVILISVCGRHKIDWKETKHWSDVAITHQRSRFGRTNIFPWSCILGMYSKSMWNKQRYCGQIQSHDLIENFSEGTEKRPFSENLRNSSWCYDMDGHAKKCVERYCELAKKTTLQLYKVSTPCIDDHHFKEENEIYRRIVIRMLSNCSEMFVFSTYWTTWYSMVSEQICTIDYKKDQRLWQTLESIDILHSSHMWI